MPRYFLEVSYKGSQYSGSQVQENANSVQEELEKAFSTYFRQKVEMTGSSRTDAGVHALQNFFHTDLDEVIPDAVLYNLNALLPDDILLRAVYPVDDHSHCRFDALGREYQYRIYRKKDPFLRDRAFFYPYAMDFSRLQEAAVVVCAHSDFSTFSKRNTQARSMICSIRRSEWREVENGFLYEVEANRFLRGMVRGLVGTMLQVGRGRMSLAAFEEIIRGKDNSQADFSVPGHGLFLVKVIYPEGLLG
jgi:tRNA pseudouridine38-40 synthase